MKKILSILVTLILAMAVLPATIGVSNSAGVGVVIEPEGFEPRAWLCADRVVLDDDLEPGRATGEGDNMTERTNNYAFEGEQIGVDVLVLDKNKMEGMEVYMTVDGDIEVNCKLKERGPTSIDSCNARIDEEVVDPSSGNWQGNWAEVASMYTCLLTVETPATMQGEFWISAVAEDLDENDVEVDETELWFLNPIVALGISGNVEFENVRPGTSAYSDTIAVTNDAEDGSGVTMDMFIGGTNFYDNYNVGTKCPDSNVLDLSRFSYHAVSGAYSTRDDARSDAEGYVGIGYANGFNDPNLFYDVYEVMQAGPMWGLYYTANLLAPGADMSVTFRLDLPVPCNADNFDDGSIDFYGEAV